MNAALLNPHKETITNYMYLGLLPFFIGAWGHGFLLIMNRGLTTVF